MRWHRQSGRHLRCTARRREHRNSKNRCHFAGYRVGCRPICCGRPRPAQTRTAISCPAPQANALAVDRNRGPAPHFEAAAAQLRPRANPHIEKRFDTKIARRAHRGKRDIIEDLTVFARGFGSAFVAQTGRKPLLMAQNPNLHGSDPEPKRSHFAG